MKVTNIFIQLFVLLFALGNLWSLGQNDTEQPKSRPDTEPLPRGVEAEFSTDFSIHSISFREILSGGPPKDGIPSINRPDFESVSTADQWLEDPEAVIVVATHQQVKIYPLQILMWHEIINDIIDDTPVSVTWCPLCNTSIVFDRRVDNRIFDFGTTGRLRFSNLLMYDRQTESWWQQAEGKAVIGELTGAQLTILPALILSWQEVKQYYPDAYVLSRNTGFSRPYGRNAYPGYDETGGIPFLYTGPPPPDTQEMMQKVYQVKIGNYEAIISYAEMADQKVHLFELAGRKLAAFFNPNPASPLDGGRVAEGRLSGSVHVFLTEDDFHYSDGKILDTKTGTVWTPFGLAVDGLRTGEQLKNQAGINHFWFSAWIFSDDRK